VYCVSAGTVQQWLCTRQASAAACSCCAVPYAVHQCAAIVLIAANACIYCCNPAIFELQLLPVNKLPISVLPDRPSLVISTVLRESCGGVDSAFGASAATADQVTHAQMAERRIALRFVRMQRLMFAMASCSKLPGPCAKSWLT
jgi:hypothetical protein